MTGGFATMSAKAWLGNVTPERIACLARGSFVAQLGMRFVATGANSLTAELRIRPQAAGCDGRLQAGIALAIAEALGTLASQAAIDRQANVVACLDVSANHCGSAAVGETVRATAHALSLGLRTHEWEVQLETGDDKLICVARLLIAIKNRTDEPVRAAA